MLDSLVALPFATQIAFAALTGLLIGSFLNVVIIRLPTRLHHQWSVQSREWLEQEPVEGEPPPGLIRPASRCCHCGERLKARHNIPVLSFLLLAGKCAYCGHKISWRYPAVELLTALLSAVAVIKLGWSLPALFACLLTWILIALSFIDLDHQILPDDVVLPTLWGGLALSLIPVFAEARDAIVGAIAGYLILWSVFHLFRMATGKNGMGHGDFKLLALLGAWLGWQYLPQIVLISTILGSLVGLGLILGKRLGSQQAMPFGPFIAGAGWLAMLFGEDINQAYLLGTGLL